MENQMISTIIRFSFATWIVMVGSVSFASVDEDFGIWTEKVHAVRASGDFGAASALIAEIQEAEKKEERRKGYAKQWAY